MGYNSALPVKTSVHLHDCLTLLPPTIIPHVILMISVRKKLWKLLDGHCHNSLFPFLSWSSRIQLTTARLCTILYTCFICRRNRDTLERYLYISTTSASLTVGICFHWCASIHSCLLDAGLPIYFSTGPALYMFRNHEQQSPSNRTSFFKFSTDKLPFGMLCLKHRQ